MTHILPLFLALGIAAHGDGQSMEEVMLARASAMLEENDFHFPDRAIHNLKFVVHDWKRLAPVFSCGIFAAEREQNLRDGSTMDVRASVTRSKGELWILAVYRDEKGRKGRFATKVSATARVSVNESAFAAEIRSHIEVRKVDGTSLEWKRHNLPIHEAVFKEIFGEDFAGRNVTVVPSYWK